MTWYRNRTDYNNSDPVMAADHNQMVQYIRYHRSEHEASGNQPIRLDDLYAPTDTTDLDATSSLHGLFPKTRYATLFLSGTGGFGTVRLATASGVTTYDTSTNYNTFTGIKFAAAATDTSWNFQVILPGNMAPVTTVDVRPYWSTQNTATSGTVVWGFKMSAIDPDSSANMGKALGTQVTSTTTVASETSNNYRRSPQVTVTPALSTGQTAMGPYDLLNIRVSRKGYDTFAGDVYLLGIMVKYAVLGPNDWP